jgi:pumilio homology domain family member 6
MAIKENKKRKTKSGDAGSTKKPKSSIGTTSAAEEQLSSSAQKRQVRKDRQSHRRHADTVAESKILWNKLRVKTNTPDDTKQLMDQVMTLIRGKVAEIALQHDASRVVQAAIQFGSPSQRLELLKELCASQEGSLAELSKIQYAHFCCLKFMKYCNRDDQCVQMIVKVSIDTEETGLFFDGFFPSFTKIFPRYVLSQRSRFKGKCPDWLFTEWRRELWNRYF